MEKVVASWESILWPYHNQPLMEKKIAKAFRHHVQQWNLFFMVK